ncbi:MAG: hypothetical protein ACREFK_11490 [Stellaceae bacterium]
MSGPSPLAAVAAAGGRFAVRGDRLRLTARTNLPAAVVESAFAEVRGWHHRHREALAHHRALHPADEAASLAWGEMQARWHRLCGERVAEWQCAGCREPIGGFDALPLGDGNRVHLGDRAGLDCLLAYGPRWRGAASRALRAMGLHPPADDDEAMP